MKLHRQAREFYTLSIATEPAVASWDASFDAGATWTTGEAATVGDTPVTQWLVAGPDAPTDEPAEILAGNVRPLIRATDNPEVIVRTAPQIVLVR